MTKAVREESTWISSNVRSSALLSPVGCLSVTTVTCVARGRKSMQLVWLHISWHTVAKACNILHLVPVYRPELMLTVTKTVIVINRAACTVYLPCSCEVRDTTVNCYSSSLSALSTPLGAALTVKCPLYRYCSAMLACNAAPTGIIESSILKSGVCSFSVVCRVVLPIPRKTKTP